MHLVLWVVVNNAGLSLLFDVGDVCCIDFCIICLLPMATRGNFTDGSSSSRRHSVFLLTQKTKHQFVTSSSSAHMKSLCFFVRRNPLSPDSGENEISLYIIITVTCSNIQVMRIKEMVTKDEMS